MLHYTQIDKLAKRQLELFKEKGKEAVLEALPKEWKSRELDDEDRREIIARLESGEIKADPKPDAPDMNSGTTKAKEGNNLDLSGFDYNALVGDAWTKYKELEATLVRRKAYIFEVYKVEPVKKPRYPGMPNTPVDTVGLRLQKDKPLRTIKLEAGSALTLNAQLPGATARVPMEYYLLAK